MSEQGNSIDYGDRIRLVEKRMHNLETYNHTMDNQMISIMNSLNENIITIVSELKARGFVKENEEKEKVEDRMEEDTITDIIWRHLD